jgi:uncharacterized membrane protein
VVVLTLAVGYLIKLPCASGDWRDQRQYFRLCYSDIVPLYSGRGIDQGLVPYLETDNEYPVLTGLSMAVAGIPAGSHASFFNWTALLLTAAAVAAAWALYRMVNERALYFALAPTLAVYGFMNWDLFAVALVTFATLAYLRNRTTAAGICLGLGTAAKLYPLLLLIPFAVGRLRERDQVGALRLTAWTVASWFAVNIPVAALAPDRWSLFYVFNASRPADWDSAWLLPQYQLGWSTATVNLLSAATFLILAAVIWIAAVRGNPELQMWKLGFPILAVFLLTNKVYSPQFSLWLLPWFALTLPDLRLFAAFEAADIAVFVTRFTWFADFQPGDLPSAAFQLSLLARGVVLVACIVAWMRREARTRAMAQEPAAVVS